MLKADDEREKNRIAIGDLTTKEINRLKRVFTQKTVQGQVITDDMKKDAIRFSTLWLDIPLG